MAVRNQLTKMNRYEKLFNRLTAGEKILMDCGTGTEVERRGIPQVESAWNSGGAKTHPDILRQIHSDYISHGAEIVISNTFATARHILQDAGWEEHFDLLNRRGVELAAEARDQSGKSDVLVAAGISHWSWGTHPTAEQLRINIADQAAIMTEAGADLIMLEMMVNIEKTAILIEESQKTGLPTWVGFSTEVDDEGVVRLWEGESLIDALEAIKPYAVPLISIMHTEVQYIDRSLDVLQANWSGPVGVYAHSGPYAEGKWLFDKTITPEAYAGASQRWLNRGVQIIGGCCGLGVEHMKALNLVMNQA